MTEDNQGMDLTVTVPASEWAALRRRVVFLEAVAIQMLRDGDNIKEWFGVAELAALRLPGLPKANNAITRFAHDAGWKVKVVPCQGGARHLYHFSDLPRRAFEALIDRIVKNPPAGSENLGNQVDQVAPKRRREKPVSPPICATNAAPAWVLPLMRIIRAEGANMSQALDALPKTLPKGTACPTREEAIEVLTRLGLVKAS